MRFVLVLVVSAVLVVASKQPVALQLHHHSGSGPMMPPPQLYAESCSASRLSLSSPRKEETSPLPPL